MSNKPPKPTGAVAALLQQVSDHANTTLVAPALTAAAETKRKAREAATVQRQTAHSALKAAASTNFESVLCAADDSIVKVSRPRRPGCDAVIHWPGGQFYVFRGKDYLRCSADLKVLPGYPKKIRTHWAKWPQHWVDGVDAAIMWPNGKAYFFKGAEYLRYTPGEGVDDGYPKLISDGWSRLPMSWANGVDAICARPGSSDKKAYLFKGKEYLRYTPRVGVDEGYPKPIASNWSKWPASWEDGISAAVAISNSKSYFFQRNEFVKYSHGFGVTKGFPQPIANAWDGWPDNWIKGNRRTESSVLPMKGARRVASIALDVAWQTMVWLQTSPLQIWRANVDGTGPKCLVDRSDLPAGAAITLGLDAVAQNIYWLESRGKSARLFRAKLKDGQPTLLKTSRIAAGDRPDLRSMIVDHQRSCLYWTDGTGIYRTRLDGSNVTRLHAFKASAGKSGVSLAINETDGLIYWNDPDTKRICRANAAGSSLAEIQELYPWEPFEGGVRFPGLAIESATGLLYWMMPSAAGAKLHFGTSDGTFDMGAVLSLKKPGPFLVVTKTEEAGLKQAQAFARQAAAQKQADANLEDAHTAAGERIAAAHAQKSSDAATAANKKQAALSSASSNKAAARKQVLLAKRKKSAKVSKRTAKIAAAKAMAHKHADKRIAATNRSNDAKIAKKRHQVKGLKHKLHRKRRKLK